MSFKAPRLDAFNRTGNVNAWRGQPHTNYFDRSWASVGDIIAQVTANNQIRHTEEYVDWN